MAHLEPPRKSVELVDSGKQQLDDALEESAELSDGGSPGERSLQTSNLRVNTDSEYLHTDASNNSNENQPSTPGGLPIPKTVVDKVDPTSPSHGDVPGTVAFEMRKMDAQPDDIREAPEITRTDLEGQSNRSLGVSFGEPLTESGMPTSAVNRYTEDTIVMSERTSSNNGDHGPREPDRDDSKSDTSSDPEVVVGSGQPVVEKAEEDFGDDFDEFEEGGEDDDFGAFDEASVQTENVESSAPSSLTYNVQPVAPLGLPLFDFGQVYGLEDIASACQPYFRQIFPSLHLEHNSQDTESSDINPGFLSERSQSLWAQLVAPPPLQPPDWVRSRIRRLFLVSLGVPVDLDEILPASKQKKLILPSTTLEGERSPRRVLGAAANGASAKLDDQSAIPSTVNSSASKLDRKQRGPPRPPDLNAHSIRHLCSMTDTALRNLTMDELRTHTLLLEELIREANEALELWLLQKDSATGDKQAFEEVIENLVKHAQRIRK